MSLNLIEEQWDNGTITADEFIDKVMSELIHTGNGELDKDFADILKAFEEEESNYIKLVHNASRHHETQLKVIADKLANALLISELP